MADASSVTSDLSLSRSKQVAICVVFLDDTLHQFQISRKALGNTLYAQVIHRFRIVEPEYFDLEFCTTSGKQYWLERTKDVLGEWKRIVGERDKESEKERREKGVAGGSARKSSAGAADLSAGDPVFYFSVKYFVPDPTQLRAENTRYLYALQIRRDLRTGQLFCSENTAALLISYIIQGDYSDYAEDFYVRARPYIRSQYKNVSLSTATNTLLNSSEFEALEQKIATYHRMHFGMTQNEADLCILDTARKIEFYGIRPYSVKDSDNIQLSICVVHFGVLIFQSRIKINSFNWSKIKKISYKKKKFVLKFRRTSESDEEPRGQEGVLEAIEFTFASKDDCRRFWQLAIDYHSFFRSYDSNGRALNAAAYPYATESLRKRAALLQANVDANASVNSAALTQSMYVAPSTPGSSYGFRPFGSLQRAALRRSMRQSMTPTPGVRAQMPVATQQNGVAGLSVPLSRHQVAPGCNTLPSRSNFGTQQQQPLGMPMPMGMARGPNGYASDTLESVRTACTSNSSGSHSLRADSRVALANPMLMQMSTAFQHQFSVESAPVVGGSQLLFGSDTMQTHCAYCSNPDYSSGYGSTNASGCCPHCGSRSLSSSQQVVAGAGAGHRPVTVSQPQQNANAGDAASLRSSTPHAHQLRHTQSMMQQAQVQVQGAYPVPLLPTGPFASGLTPSSVRNSITNASQAAVGAANQLDALAISATPGSGTSGSGGRTPDLSAFSATVAVNTNTLNGRRGSGASTSANVNAGANLLATPQQADGRMSTAGRQASPALGVSAIEAQQETRLKSFQSFRTQKSPVPTAGYMVTAPAAATNRSIGAPSPNLQSTNRMYPDARNSASLSMASNGSDSTMPESTATGSSAGTDTPRPDTKDPSTNGAPEVSASAANTLTRPDDNAAKQPQEDCDLYTPLAALSSGFPTSPAAAAFRSPPGSTVSSSPANTNVNNNANANTNTNALLISSGNSNQSYLTLLALDALCQERTYVKDLQIVAVHLAAYVREHASQFAGVDMELSSCQTQATRSSSMLFDSFLRCFVALHEKHTALLNELEMLNSASQVPAQSQRVGYAFLELYVTGSRFDAELYRTYLVQMDQFAYDYFMRLTQTSGFDPLIAKFEQETKLCYLFVNDVIIKPLIHLHEYSLCLKKIENYVQMEGTEQFLASDHVLRQLSALSVVLQRLLGDCGPRIERLLRYLGLLEIRKDVLLNYAPLLDRATFVRFGFVYKLSKKGYQQRMLFLFSDFLLCANRTLNPSAVQFRARHCYSLTDVQIAPIGTPRATQPDVQPSIGTHSFQLTVNASQPAGQSRSLTLVANNEMERSGWLADITKAIALAQHRLHNRAQSRPLSPTRPMSPSNLMDNEDAAMLSLITQVADTSLSESQSNLPRDASREEMRSPTPSTANAIATNSLVCVCWHRNNSLNAPQFGSLLENQISGFLLRKFQNSNGWQRLWSVFTKCCLFFYKSHQDEAPIASLPLWGYTVAMADETDQVQKAFVFKLTYKTHKYYFRTENELAFNRWMQTLRAALLNNMQV